MEESDIKSSVLLQLAQSDLNESTLIVLYFNYRLREEFI